MDFSVLSERITKQVARDAYLSITYVHSEKYSALKCYLKFRFIDRGTASPISDKDQKVQEETNHRSWRKTTKNFVRFTQINHSNGIRFVFAISFLRGETLFLSLGLNFVLGNQWIPGEK